MLSFFPGKVTAFCLWLGGCSVVLAGLPAGDPNQDGDRDLQDWSTLQRCFSASDAVDPVACGPFLFDLDNAVSLQDHARFGCDLGGPNVQVLPQIDQPSGMTTQDRSILLTGTTSGAASLTVTGGEAVVQVGLEDCSFAVDIPLTANATNTLQLTFAYGNGQQHEPIEWLVTQQEVCPSEWVATGDCYTGVDGLVKASIVWNDGTGDKLYIGGDIAAFDCSVGPFQVATWNGTQWEGLPDFLGEGYDATVNALAVYDDGSGEALYAAGSVVTTGGNSYAIAKWNGTEWQIIADGVQSGPMGVVNTMVAFDDGNGPLLYVGGLFSQAVGIQANNVLRWNGKEWSQVAGAGGAGTSGVVAAMTVHDDGQGSALYVGGHFAFAGSAVVNNIARWNGTEWSALIAGSSAGLTTPVVAMTSFESNTDSTLIVSIGIVCVWDGQGWGNFQNTGFDSFFSSVKALQVIDLGNGPELFAGGVLDAGSPSTKVSQVAKWNGTLWQPLTEQPGVGADAPIFTLAGYSESGEPAIFAGGHRLTKAGGKLTGGVARWNGVTWSAVSEPMITGLNGPILAMALYDDGNGMALYAGGEFTSYNGTTLNYIAKWNGSGWSPITTQLGTGVNGPVYALKAVNYGAGYELFVGGDFTIASGVTVNRIARWNGTKWNRLNGLGGIGVNDSVYAIVEYDDGTGPALVIGGAFTSAGGLGTARIAKWDGAKWSKIGDGVGNNDVKTIVVFDDGSGPMLYVAGNLIGTAWGFVVVWDGTSFTSISNGFISQTGFQVLSVYDHGDGEALFIGGLFQLFPIQASNKGNIAKWNGQKWGSISDTQGQGTNNLVTAMATHDDGNGNALYVGGEFTIAGGIAASRMARWDGTDWSSLTDANGNGTSHTVRAMLSFDDGSGPALFVGGDFAVAGGQMSPYFARWQRPYPPCDGD